MSSRGASALTPASPVERDAVVDVAKLVLRETAPAELMIFDQAAEEYFDNPAAALSSRSREEAIGFGLDLALITPVLLAVVTGVVRFLSTLVADAVREEGSAEVARRVRQLFTRDESGAAADSGTTDVTKLDEIQVRRVHDVARDRAMALGLGKTDADVLADAIAGRLQVAQ